MGILTPPIKLNINCAKHGSSFYEDPTCTTCHFLSGLTADIKKLQTEMDRITKSLETEFKAGTVVVTDVGGAFFRGLL